MIAQSAKPATNQPAQKGETSSSKIKSRLASKRKPNISNAKPESLSSSKTPCDFPPKFCNNRPTEDYQLRMKLMELTPRNPAAQTAQGVQDFIKQVSKFIEKKSPFNVIPEKKFCPDPVNSEYALRDQTVAGDPKIFQSNKMGEHKRVKNFPEKPDTVEKSKIASANAQPSKIRTVLPSMKGVQRGPLTPMPEFGIVNEPKGVGGTATNKKELKVVGSIARFEGWKNEESQSSPSANRQSNQTRRSGRSEIPLRKTRTDMSKSPKPISLLLQKPLKEVDSAVSIDFYSKKKPFTPIEELSLCSEKQGFNAHASSEKLNHVGKKNSPGTFKKDVLVEEANNWFKLDRCFKSANIPIFSNPSSSDVPDQKLCTVKISKILDMDKVRTSSFTVLRNSREALCRLESLHQQNVSTKENAFGDRVSSSKLKILTPKSSFNSLKAKGSKKNLSARLSSKGNKPTLKIKTRKCKKDTEESLMLPRKSQKVKSKTPEICRKATRPEVWKVEEVTKEGSPNRKSRESESASKCSILRCRSSDTREFAPREELSPPTSTKLKAESEEIEIEPKSPRGSSKKAIKLSDSGGVDKNNSNENIEFLSPLLRAPESVAAAGIATENNSPDGRQTDEDERSSSRTITLGGALIDEASSLSSEDSQIQYQPQEKMSSKDCEMTSLAIKGAPLKFGKDEPPEKPEGSEPKKNKLHIKIDLATTPEDSDCEENNNTQSFDWLYPSDNNYGGGQPPHEGGSNGLENKKNEDIEDTHGATPELLSRESKNEEEKGQAMSVTQKSRKSSSFLRNRPQHKVPGANLKGVRKKKIRSDAGDRRLPSSTGFFKSMSLQNKMKLDTKLRSGLTKAYIREEKREMFDDTVAIKLKRRNSEPISFRGYIWKRADSVTPRGHKASVSSMTSSLKHLNTDDIDDFIFWEAVPQKMTACWEMSLYHFKRPWSVLSCSVFEDNRQSSTPGLILENLKNGGSLIPRRSPLNSNERPGCPKNNPFDVEPSIAQKNIDIRNWLAALNFPTPPSTSVDVIREGNFLPQSPIDAQSLNKGQVNPKRKKVLPSLRFSEETTENKLDEKESKYKKSAKWDARDVGGFMNLIRRKSGGFVTNEQFLNSEHSIHRPNVTVNLCLNSKTPEEAPTLRKEDDGNVSSEPTALKTGGTSPVPKEVNCPEQLEPTQGDEAAENLSTTAHQKFHWRRLLPLPTDLNVWKYLFLFTLIIITVHSYFLNNSVGRS